jgi:DNA-binding MarR family transcriptional regulator
VTEHPTNGIDETVHQRHRLGILTITAEADRAEFGYLRDALDLTPGNLSRHLTVLEEAGLVDVEKGYAGRRPRTWVRITRQGRSALAAELDVLAALVRQHAVMARRSRITRRGDGQPAAGEAAQRPERPSVAGDDAPPNAAPPNDAPPNAAPPNDAPPNDAPPNDAPPNDGPPGEEL